MYRLLTFHLKDPGSNHVGGTMWIEFSVLAWPNFMALLTVSKELALMEAEILCLRQAYFTGKRVILASAHAYSALPGILHLQG